MEKAGPIVWWIIQSGHRFSPEEVPGLRRVIPGSSVNCSIAHWFAESGYRFSLDDLLVLQNVRDDYGQTVAHYMAITGYSFPRADAQRLGDPVDRYGLRVDKWFHQYERILEAQQKQRNVGRKYRLMFEQDKPTFSENNRPFEPLLRISRVFTGRKIQIAFGFWDMNSEFRIFNHFQVCLEQHGAVWTTQLVDVERCDNYRYLTQRIVLLELVEQLNQALKTRQDLDFSEFYLILHNTEFWGHFAFDMEVDA